MSVSALIVPNNIKTRSRRNGVALEIDESKMCPFAEQYDVDLHDFVSSLRRVDGSILVHTCKYCIFSAKGTCKYWVRASTPVLG